jgi:hypothetical protein
VRCRLADLAAWADWAPSVWIESLSGAWCASTAEEPDGAEVLLLGAAHTAARAESRPPGSIRLPAFDGRRFWGSDVLIPLGYRAEPELCQRALGAAVGAGPDDLVVLAADGPELIPRRAFRPLSRASIRLAGDARAPAPATGVGPP